VNGETTKSNKTINVIQDISSVTEMESVLKSREERYKLAVTSRKTGLWECEDINTGKVWWSEEYLALLEYDENALQKGYEHFLSIIHPDDYPNFKEELENSFNTKQPFSCLLRLQHQSKGYRWYEIYGITELEKKSKKKRLICCISDIHERVIYQKVIESKQKLLTNIFDYSSVGFVVADGKGIIEECSNGFARTVGIDPAEIKGKAYYEFISKDQKEAFYQNFEKLTKEEIPFLKMEAHYVGGMNQQIWCKVHITPIAITTESGHDENKYCAIITDQTEEKNQETDLQPIFPELDSMSTSTSEIIHSQISELRENLQSSEDNRKGNLALLDSLDQNLNKIQSQLASMNDYNSLLNTNSDFSNINLNKLIKKTINEDILGQKINLKKEILPGIYAVESQIELLIQSIIKVAYHLCNQNIPDDLTLSAKANSSSWEFKLNLQSKSLSSSLLEEANRYLMGEISKIEDQHQLVILLLVCRKIINNHKGNFYLLNSKKSGCDILFSIAKYE